MLNISFFFLHNFGYYPLFINSSKIPFSKLDIGSNIGPFVTMAATLGNR